MVCEAVRQVIRQFMDDLLDEKDYQDIHAHLVSCQRCHTYASSVGTLSYRLYELGQTTLPPDMVSTILYELKKAPTDTAADPMFPQFVESSSRSGFTAQTRLFWYAVLTLATISVLATATVFFWRPHAKPSLAPLVKINTGAILMERHFHLALSGRPELVGLVTELQLAAEQDSERSLVFLVPIEKSSQFRERLESVGGDVKEFGESISMEDARDERITFFFE